MYSVLPVGLQHSIKPPLVSTATDTIAEFELAMLHSYTSTCESCVQFRSMQNHVAHHISCVYNGKDFMNGLRIVCVTRLQL